MLIMSSDIQNYMENFDQLTQERFRILYNLIYECSDENIIEKLWAKLPSFYVEDNFVRIIPFKDHFNLEAKAVLLYKDEIKEFKITPKGMLQIFHNQQIPSDILKNIFRESFI